MAESFTGSELATDRLAQLAASKHVWQDRLDYARGRLDGNVQGLQEDSKQLSGGGVQQLERLIVHVTAYQRTLAKTAYVMQRELEKLENLVEELKDTDCSCPPSHNTCSLTASS